MHCLKKKYMHIFHFIIWWASNFVLPYLTITLCHIGINIDELIKPQLKCQMDTTIKI